MTDPEKKPLLPLLSSVLAEHVREFSEQARSELGAGLDQLRQELGARHFDERLREFASEARAQFREGVDQFRQELEQELAEVRARRGEKRGDGVGENSEAPPKTNADGPTPDDQETQPVPRVRVVDPPSDN